MGEEELLFRKMFDLQMIPHLVMGRISGLVAETDVQVMTLITCRISGIWLNIRPNTGYQDKHMDFQPFSGKKCRISGPSVTTIDI